MNQEEKDILEAWGKLSLDSKRELLEVFLEDFPDVYPTHEDLEKMLDERYSALKKDVQSRADKVWAKGMKQSNEDFRNFLWSLIPEDFQDRLENRDEAGSDIHKG